MFHPDGLVPLKDIMSVCQSVAYDRFYDPAVDSSIDAPDDPRITLYSELLFSRFLEAHEQELWIFQYPDVILRASSLLLFQDRFYDGPCPESIEQAEAALEHLKRGPRGFLTQGYRVTANLAPEIVRMYGLEEAVSAANMAIGALVCWKPEKSPVELEARIRRFVDHVYWRDVPTYSAKFLSDAAKSGLAKTWEDFLVICPQGKEASGLTWEEIQEKTGWSRRQIVRAGKWLCCANAMEDSLIESSMEACLHEQTEAPDLPHHELA